LKLPKQVIIGQQVWAIREQKRKDETSIQDGHYGYTQSKDAQITIDAEMPEALKRVTLVHELLHAIRFTFGGSFKPARSTEYEEWEHYWIGVYEEPLVMLLRDNPELAAYLVAD